MTPEEMGRLRRRPFCALQWVGSLVPRSWSESVAPGSHRKNSTGAIEKGMQQRKEQADEKERDRLEGNMRIAVGDGARTAALRRSRISCLTAWVVNHPPVEVVPEIRVVKKKPSASDERTQDR